MSLTGDGAVVKEVKSMEFLGAPPANDTTCSMVKKAQQYHRALRRPKSTSLPAPVLTTFCTGTILTWGLIPWFGSCKAAPQCQLNRTDSQEDHSFHKSLAIGRSAAETSHIITAGRRRVQRCSDTLKHISSKVVLLLLLFVSIVLKVFFCYFSVIESMYILYVCALSLSL